MYFTGSDCYQNFLVFAPILSSLVSGSNKKVTNWILTGTSPENVKPFDTNLEPTVFNLSNGKEILKFKNCVLVLKIFSSLYSNFIFNLYIIYELNTWPHNPINTSLLKIVYLVHLN